MEIRKSGERPESSPKPRKLPSFEFLVSICAFSLLLGCASPGDPIERKPPVPETVKDLAASQSGNDVALTFTLPKETVERRVLKHAPGIEIYRDFVPVSAGTPSLPAAANPTLLFTIPSEVLDKYLARGRVRFVDTLTAGDFAKHSGSEALYMVRTRASRKRESADSNVVALQIYPAADPVEDLKAEITHSAVALTWTTPRRTVAGPAPPIAAFEIFRVQPETAAPTGAPSPAPQKGPLKIGESTAPEFRDTQFEFGKTYVYSVKSVIHYPGLTLESAESNLLSVTPKDVFPPAAPQGLVAVYVPAAGGVPAHLELSWAINPETDIAGYNVYRSEEPGSPGTRVNAELLLTPVFRDMNAVPGRRYSYSVTAVDRSGNESPAGASVVAGIPSEGPSSP
ncbi:MAG TPA: fibronectin type III domain-containing protein [Candidatus Sulfotelmatobacter sp.]|nr:fibronectin type III domain-containing protein [Candidatus Sulfotelmatobacter sp.]